MKRLGVIGLLIWLLLISGLITLNGRLLAFALPLIAYLAIGAVLRPESPIEALSQLNKPSVSEGDTVTVQLSLTARSAPIELLEFADQRPVGLSVSEGTDRGLARLTEAQPIETEYRLTATRGLHHFPGIACMASDPFDLFRSEQFLPAERTLLVRPSYNTIRRLNLRPLRTGVLAGAYPAQAGGPGVEFFGLRRYTAGDPLRWVNWRASARNGRSLYVNLFQQERVIDLGLIVDARISSNAMTGGSIYPYSIAAAAALAELFLSQGNRVGLLIYGSHLDWTVPAYGRMQRERIMSALAKTTEGESRIFNRIEHLPTRLFRPKTQLVLVSPLLRGDVDTLVRLRARRYPLLVISPDRDRLEAKALSGDRQLPLAERLAQLEQQLVTRKLANAGVLRLVWDVEIPFEQLIEQRLSRPLAWMRAIGVSS